MIFPAKNPLKEFFLRNYFHHIVKTDFHSFNYNTDWQIEEKGLLLLGNHFSWWDGFIPYYLNKLFLKKNFHIIMLEDELRKRPFFRYVGSYSIQPQSRSVIDTINFTAQLLQNPKNMVVLFPQGKIQSLFADELLFEKGALKIIEKAGKDNIQVVFNTTLIDYLANRKPSLYLYLKPYKVPENITPEQFKYDFMAHYKESKQRQGTLRA
jgi:1-acyl-sn-glycerol-3-phosphate acyltransferase